MTNMLTLSSYQAAAQRTDLRCGVDDGISFSLLGLFGETGSLLSEVKKKQRDSIAYLGYEESVVEEFGDVLWYLAAVADHAHLSLSDLAVNLDLDLEGWRSEGDEDLTFEAIEHTTQPVANEPFSHFESALMQLSAEVGLLMNDHCAGRLQHDRSALKGRLVGVLRALRTAAQQAGVSLGQAASFNLEKIQDRWPQTRVAPPFFDDGFPVTERLPRRLVIEIEEVEQDGRTVSKLVRDGLPLGDPLTDNRTEDDDYRFHDVFHLAYAAHLGWSPTLRRLLGVKRKSDPLVDEVQDGARAVLIEEGIATWIFNHAQRLSLFHGVATLDYGLLKSVRRFVSGYEVERCPLWLWEEAILNGYEIFREVCVHRGGTVGIDLNKRKMWFDAP